MTQSMKNKKEFFSEFEEKFNEIESIVYHKNWQRSKITNKERILTSNIEDKKVMKCVLEVEEDFNRITKLLIVIKK